MADELIELGRPARRMDRPFMSQRPKPIQVSPEAVAYLEGIYSDAVSLLAETVGTDASHLEEGQSEALTAVEGLVQEVPSLGALVARVDVSGAVLGKRTDFRALLERIFGKGDTNALLADARAKILQDAPKEIRNDVARAVGGKPGEPKGEIGVAEVAVAGGLGLALVLALA